MRYSKPHAAVFTPAMPYLDAFLSRHVRPDHPLRHHPLWISSQELSGHPNIEFDGGCAKNSKGKDTNESPLMVVAQVPQTLILYNLDQLSPESEVRWQLPPVEVPMSISTKQPYGLDIKRQLDHLRKMKGFESNWWGSKRRWEFQGGRIPINAFFSPVKVYAMVKLLHISMLLNGEEILKHSFVSGKTGLFNTWWGHTNSSPSSDQFQQGVERHFNKHGFQSPLYFSKAALQRAGIAVRPDADPLDMLAYPTGANFTMGNGNSSIPKNSKAYQQYYHLSQLVLPDNYRIPPVVLQAERTNPDRPIHGISGKLLDIPELEYEALLNSPSPELASIIKCEDTSQKFSSYTDLESPLAFRGRNLWFLPHDVLELGGLIDVNSVPVEVHVSKLDESGRKLYNVEQLVQPLEGYKAVGSILLMNRYNGESETESDD
ncbi:uncharacterized protein TM35_000132180 [Trypanosoma theileri]|uniref:Uncharacterized protein n=1 Tax=Trypanosoma theileri TaxID=67003 RepID=A0A1X0NWY0_9TRYP|nr:uncharacterized protein TM35_000132180 [Trypanosoma theileri]ORC89214.1 hypothetical protein TM35_000132180 [Trypanosoma theileri]